MIVAAELDGNGDTSAYHQLHDPAPPYATATILLTHAEHAVYPRGSHIVVQCHAATCYRPGGVFRPAYLPLDLTFLALELVGLVVCALAWRRRHRAHRLSLGAHLPSARIL